MDFEERIFPFVLPCFSFYHIITINDKKKTRVGLVKLGYSLQLSALGDGSYYSSDEKNNLLNLQSAHFRQQSERFSPKNGVFLSGCRSRMNPPPPGYSIIQSELCWLSSNCFNALDWEHNLELTIKIHTKVQHFS